MRRLAWTSVVFLSFGNVCLAQNAVPPIEIPHALKAYMDADNVAVIAKEIIGLLGSVKFDQPGSESPFAKAPCNDAATTAFYRGMVLSQAAYFIFINKSERGFIAVDSPHLRLDDDNSLHPRTDFGALVRPGREVLVSVWPQVRLAKLMALAATFGQLPPGVRSDLAAYYTTLLEFSGRYTAVTNRAPGKLAKLSERAAPEYALLRDGLVGFAKSQGESTAAAEEKYPAALSYESYSAEVRKLLNTNRELGQAEISSCFDGGRFAALHLGDAGELTYFPYGFYPASYMIGFWERRENEGTASLARFALGRIISELHAPQ
jgi:hypothetical protein